MIEGLDSDKCQRRNRLAALRGNVEATPVRFCASAAAGELSREWEGKGGMHLDRHGRLPEDTSGALSLINSLLPDGAPDLTDDDVFIHYCEAANSSLIPDRWGFLDSATLLNIAKGADLGRAFMNSHRTGDVSVPSELPFGKTFVGQYEQYLTPEGKIYERTLLGFYMLRDCLPNGANGPTTDTLHRMIDGGVLHDVSVGLYPGIYGKVLCNVCNQNLRQCAHYPGTNRNMELSDQERARDETGVPTGYATYRLSNWEMGETSAVYDGAINGAGFSKGYSEFSKGGFSADHAAQFQAAYSALLVG